MELAEAGTTISADVPGHLAKREFLRGYSIEVMPRSAAAAGSLRGNTPGGDARLRRPYRRYADR